LIHWRDETVQHLDDPEGVLHVSGHAQRQGLDPQQQVEGVRRAHARTEVPQALGAGTHRQGLGAELLGEGDAVVAVVGL